MTEIKLRLPAVCRLFKFTTNFSCILFMCLLFVTGEAQSSEHFQVVTHPQVNEDILSANVLRAIFSMSIRTWSNGNLIRVFVLPDNNDLHHDFAKERLKVFPYQLRLAWDRLVFSGTGQAPISVSSHDEMLAKVASTPGAIGYLKTTYINENIHVLQIK